MLSSFSKLIKEHIIEHTDIGTLHAQGFSFNKASTFKLAQSINDYGTGDPHSIRDLTGHQNTLIAVQLFKDGECVYDCPPLDEVKKHCAEQIDTLWDEVLRFDNPHNYYVDLSQKLWDEKQRLLAEHGKKDEQ